MFRFAVFAALTGLLLLPAPAWAQAPLEPAVSEAPTALTTPPRDIAMIYYRFTGLTPPLDTWAEQTAAYQAAPAFDKETVRHQQAALLQQSFDLLGLNERIVVQMPVILSDYSLNNKGFLAENLTAETSFRFSYAGENFIVVPRGIQDRDWLPAEGLAAKTLDDLRNVSPSGREVVATFFLAPKFGETAPIDIEGVPYRVIAADILDMVFFDKNGNVAWRNKLLTEDPNAKVRQNDLLQLYQ